jgi:hypothetical protein
MNTPIKADTANPSVGLFQATAPSQPVEITSKNPVHDLQMAIQSQNLTGSGKEIIELMKRHCPDIRLSELPAEVAQMILSSQHKGIMEILDNWSESIQEQAVLDKEANKRSTLQNENLERSQKHRDALVHALAARSSDPAPTLAPHVTPAVQAVVEHRVATPEQDALKEPTAFTGVQLHER